MTLEIRRRYNFDEWELIAEYDGEEFTGDEDFLDAFRSLEGEDEEEVIEEFDGPNLIAAPVEAEEKGDSPLAQEIAESAVDALSQIREKDGVGSGTAGAGQATYGGAGDPDDEEDEEREKSDGHISGPFTNGVSIRLEEDEVYCEDSGEVYEIEDDLDDWQCPGCGEDLSDLTKSGPDFGEMDEALMKLYQNVVWWKVEEDDPDLSKAPGVWRGEEDVPEFVKRFIDEAINEDAFWQGDFEDLPQGARIRMQDVFQDTMTQDEGWSVSDLVDELQDEFAGLTKDHALKIARTETAAIANKAREEAYEQRPDTEEYEFYWTGPEDHRTTPICSWLKSQTHPKHGGSPVSGMDELRELFERAAKVHDDFDGMTEERFDEYVPHHQCRHTFVREVYL